MSASGTVRPRRGWRASVASPASQACVASSVMRSKGTASSVFLALGPALITARPGDTLDGGFRLDALTTRELTFTHLATQKTVRMAIEGETP